MKTDPKIGDIGIYFVNGLKMEVKLREDFNQHKLNLLVSGPRESAFLAVAKFIQWDKEIELVDKPIVLDPNIDWHNDLDQDSLRQGYRPLVKGEDKEKGDEYYDTLWNVITIRGTAYAGTKYRTKRPLSDFINSKRNKLTAKIKELKQELKKTQLELANI